LYSMLLYFPCGHFITTVVRLIQPKKKQVLTILCQRDKCFWKWLKI
jgi:hypothetical protein